MWHVMSPQRTRKCAQLFILCERRSSREWQENEQRERIFLQISKKFILREYEVDLFFVQAHLKPCDVLLWLITASVQNQQS